MRLGVVILPELQRDELAATWRAAEQLGFAHAWTYDHLAWRALRDAPWYAAVPTLAAAALATARIRLGPLVASPNFRHPVAFAREVIALDELSNGRLALGLGAGGTGWDATILGQAPWTPQERAERFAEFATLLDRLLREPATSYAGRYYSASEARSLPGCVQRPRVPLVIAATRPRGMRLVAQLAETWVTTGDRAREGVPPAEGAKIVAGQGALLDAACAAAGRDPATLGRMVLTGVGLHASADSADALRQAIGCYAAAGVTDLVLHWPRPAEPFAGDRARFERAVSDVLTGRASR